MEPVEGSRTFGVAATTYDSFMGRYSKPLSPRFADAAGVRRGQTAVDVGCGPGALTGTLVERLGAAAVAACDPSPGFVADCRDRHPGVRVEQGRAESIPFDDDAFDHALAQLVLHFVSDASEAAHEMARVVRPGGHVSVCVWDFADGTEMLRAFLDAAVEIDPDAPDEARTLRFGRHGEIAELFEAAGLVDITESTLTVSSTYAHFDELWQGFLAGVGPAGAHLLALPADRQRLLHDRLFERVSSPSAAFSLSAVARCVVARVPQ